MKIIKRSITGHIVGQNHHRAKLTDSQVREIRSRHMPYAKGFGYKSLADEYQVGVSTIRDICTYRTRVSA